MGCSLRRSGNEKAMTGGKRTKMEKVRGFARHYTLAYGILAEIIFLAFLTGAGFLVGTLMGEGNYYVRLLVQEAAAAALAWGMLAVSGLLPVLQNRGSGFGKGLLCGMYLLVIGVYSMVVFLAVYEGARVLQPWYLIGAYLACMCCVGVAEEFLFRGVIATLFLQKFGTEKGGIWKAVVISGVLFGLAHVSNIMSGALVGVLVQTAVASMLGMVFAAIYFRTGCIWVTVFLHAFIDVAAGITTGLYGNETLMDTVSSYSPVQLISCVPYLIVLLVLLRKKKLGDVEKNTGTLLSSI